MPLKSGKSDQAVSDNIKKLMDEYKRGDGKIGNYRPPSAKKAQNAAVAIGGDQYADANSSKADVGAITGAAVGGAAGAAAALAVPGVGAALALGIIGVCAYTGSSGT
jgi:hypothetical protein